jgi:hypothetical protein
VWPPTKAEMGKVLLEAHMTALAKHPTKQTWY